MVGFFPYFNLVVHAAISIAITFIITATKFPVWVLEGIHTYIHPENLGNGGQENVRAAIRRPETEKGFGLEDFKNLKSGEDSGSNGNRASGFDQSQSGFAVNMGDKSKKKKRDRVKEKIDFDEGNAQIFRLRLVDGHLQTRIYFKEYQESVVYSVVALSNLLAHQFLPSSEVSQNSKFASLFMDGSVIPIFFGVFAVYKLFTSLLKSSFERSASKRSEKQLSILSGFLGFLFSLLIILVLVPDTFEFKFDSVNHEEIAGKGNFQNGFMKIFLAVFAGCISGFLFIPASKNARSYWLGTDQLRWNLSVISCGKLARILLYINFLMTIFTSLLWINPMAGILVKEESNNVCQENPNGFSSEDHVLIGGYTEFYYSNKFKLSQSNAEDFDLDETERKEAKESGADCIDLKRMKTESKHKESWVREVGMLPSAFAKFKLQCLLICAILQLLTLRPNLQMYLNEAVLSWYQRLHTSKVPDLDFSRAKIFLHNYYLCQVVLQFFIPPALVLLFLGLSRLQSNSAGTLSLIHGFMSCFSFLKEGTVFMAWWVVFVLAIFTSLNLSLYRFGFQFIS